SALPLAKQLVFADQQLQVRALLVGELEKHLFTLGVLEPFAVALEELVRAALAADADEQRLLVVDAALAQLLGPIREQAARRPLEEQERRPRLELRVLRGELAVPLFQRAEMFPLLSGEPLEHGAAARVLRHSRRTRVELQAASLGRDGHAKRVAGEH